MMERVERIGVWTSVKPLESKNARKRRASSARRRRFSIGAEERQCVEEWFCIRPRIPRNDLELTTQVQQFIEQLLGSRDDPSITSVLSTCEHQCY